MERGRTRGATIGEADERVAAGLDDRSRGPGGDGDDGVEGDVVRDDRSGGSALVLGLSAFTVAIIGMDALFDSAMLDQQGVIGLTDAVAAPFLRPFEALMGTDGGWRTACAAAATYAFAAILILRALRRAEAGGEPEAHGQIETDRA
jgi:hypothetical protein